MTVLIHRERRGSYRAGIRADMAGLALEGDAAVRNQVQGRKTIGSPTSRWEGKGASRASFGARHVGADRARLDIRINVRRARGEAPFARGETDRLRRGRVRPTNAPGTSGEKTDLRQRTR